MMDAKLKADWVKALRSGEYKQARFRLKTEGGFCCLGVLCEVAALRTTEDGTRVEAAPNDDGYLPIRNLMGCDANVIDHLAELNDDGQMPFSKIADYIEQNL